MKPLHVAQTTMLSELASDPQEPLPDTFLDLGPVGSAIGHQAAFCFIGTMTTPVGGERIVVATGRKGCACGCNSPGRAFISTPTVDEARALAQQLIGFADELEAKAAKAAADLLGKVTK